MEPTIDSAQRLFRSKERVIRSTARLVGSQAETDRAADAPLAPIAGRIAIVAALGGGLADIMPASELLLQEK
jgi:hypothetical protein